VSNATLKTMGRAIRSIEDPRLRTLFEVITQNIITQDDRIAALESPDAPSWLDMKLQNGWVQYDGGYFDPKYYKDPHNVVHLRGMIKSGTAAAGTVLFTLPEGYRPQHKLLIDGISNDALSRIDIHPVGDVTVEVGNTAWISLDGISFDAYQ